MSTDPRDSVALKEKYRLLDSARSLALLCRTTIDAVIADGLESQRKQDGSIVTNADREAERVFREAAAERFPNMGVLGEEHGSVNVGASWQWIIDPIDGTAEFDRGLPLWGTIIGLFYEGRPVVGVLDHGHLGVQFYAAHGCGAYREGKRIVVAAGQERPRRISLPSRAAFEGDKDETAVYDALIQWCGNARTYHTCYAHASVAFGALDVGVEWRSRIWDIAATQVIVEEAGGRFLVVQKEASRTSPSSAAESQYSAVYGAPRPMEEAAEVIRAALAGLDPQPESED